MKYIVKNVKYVTNNLGVCEICIHLSFNKLNELELLTKAFILEYCLKYFKFCSVNVFEVNFLISSSEIKKNQQNLCLSLCFSKLISHKSEKLQIDSFKNLNIFLEQCSVIIC